MLKAVNAEQNEIYTAIKAFRVFENPHREKWFCCDSEKVPVTPVKAHNRDIGGIVTKVISHFRCFPERTALCWAGESDIHKAWKVVLASLIENQEIEIDVAGFTIPISRLGIKQSKIEYILEKGKTDVGVPLTKFNPLLGKGIAFEIQKSPITQEEIEQRERKWFEQCYSVAWIPINFIDINEFSLKRKEIPISVPWIYGTYTNLSEWIKETISDVTVKAIDERLRDSRIVFLPQEASCSNCEYGRVDNWYPEVIACWRRVWIKKENRPEKESPKEVCRFWEPIMSH